LQAVVDGILDQIYSDTGHVPGRYDQSSRNFYDLNQRLKEFLNKLQLKTNIKGNDKVNLSVNRIIEDIEMERKKVRSRDR
jgi:hypothetical protein